MRSVEESLAQSDKAHKRPDHARRIHVSHRHLEFAMLHPAMQVIAERVMSPKHLKNPCLPFE